MNVCERKTLYFKAGGRTYWRSVNELIYKKTLHEVREVLVSHKQTDVQACSKLFEITTQSPKPLLSLSPYEITGIIVRQGLELLDATNSINLAKITSLHVCIQCIMNEVHYTLGD